MKTNIDAEAALREAILSAIKDMEGGHDQAAYRTLNASIVTVDRSTERAAIQPAGAAVAWEYEYLSDGDNDYGQWRTVVTRIKGDIESGYHDKRNVRALVYAAPISEATALRTDLSLAKLTIEQLAERIRQADAYIAELEAKAAAPSSEASAEPHSMTPADLVKRLSAGEKWKLAEVPAARTPAIAGSIGEDKTFRMLMQDIRLHPRTALDRLDEMIVYLDTIIQGARNEPR